MVDECDEPCRMPLERPRDALELLVRDAVMERGCTRAARGSDNGRRDREAEEEADEQPDRPAPHDALSRSEPSALVLLHVEAAVGLPGQDDGVLDDERALPCELRKCAEGLLGRRDVGKSHREQAGARHPRTLSTSAGRLVVRLG